MPTVHRTHGLRFVIFTDDHRPAHVHVVSGGGEAKIALGVAGEPPKLVWVKGIGNADVRRAIAEVAGSQAMLRAAWVRIHGEFD